MGKSISGAEKLLVAYFNALKAEVNIAANAIQIEGFRDIAAKLMRLLNRCDSTITLMLRDLFLKPHL